MIALRMGTMGRIGFRVVSFLGLALGFMGLMASMGMWITAMIHGTAIMDPFRSTVRSRSATSRATRRGTGKGISGTRDMVLKTNTWVDFRGWGMGLPVDSTVGAGIITKASSMEV
jgi:hypothetical protein